MKSANAAALLSVLAIFMPIPARKIGEKFIFIKGLSFQSHPDFHIIS
jgi:hypothetical protein